MLQDSIVWACISLWIGEGNKSSNSHFDQNSKLKNFLSQFVEGLVAQTMDANQDSHFGQSLFIPNLLGEFDLDEKVTVTLAFLTSKVKIIISPEFSLTHMWSGIAWSAASTRSVTHRAVSAMGCRSHWGHPDFLDAIFVMVGIFPLLLTLL